MKKITAISMVLLLLLNANPVLAREKNQEASELAPTVKSAILIERDTGTILYDKNADKKLPPASMTKIMTMLLIMEALDSGQIKLSDKVRTSENAASMGGSQVFLEPGEELTVKQMLDAISIASANDACVAMAEKLAGSEEEFVKKMNKRVSELGLKNTQFQNSTGLPAKKHYSSAADMAAMGRELLKHKKITEFTGQYESFLRENTDKQFWLVNTNRLVKFYPGVDGLKTGFTDESKYCLTATAERDGMRIVAVVFGAKSPKDRNAEVTNLLDYGFNQYATKRQYAKGEKLAFVPVSKGSIEKVNLVAADHVTLLMKKGESMKDVHPKMTLKKNIQAPIKKGQVLGKITIEKDGKLISTTDLIATEDVNEASWLKLFGRSLSNFTQVKK